MLSLSELCFGAWNPVYEVGIPLFSCFGELVNRSGKVALLVCSEGPDSLGCLEVKGLVLESVSDVAERDLAFSCPSEMGSCDRHLVVSSS